MKTPHKKTFLIFFGIQILISATVFGQETWFFGAGSAGMKFSVGNLNPTPLNNMHAPLSREGAAILMHPNGEDFIFYTSGDTLELYDKVHQPIKNGNGLEGGESGVQPIGITPVPNSCNQYYICLLYTSDAADD